MISTCPKCNQLYQALECDAADPHRRCPKCTALAELLEAAAPAIRFLLNRTVTHGRELGFRLEQAARRVRETR